MIAQYVVQRVQELLRLGGMNHRQIASETGVSKGSVDRIAKGKIARRSRSSPRHVRVKRQRCRGCGGTIVLSPCVFCTAITGQ